MLAAAEQQRALAVQRRVFQPGQRTDQRHHADMQMTIEHAQFDLARGGHADIDAYPRAALLQCTQGMGDAHLRQGHQVVDDADVQLAAQVPVQVVDLGAEALQRRQQRLGGAVHLAALVGQGEAGAAALAQAHAQALFQVAHVQADRRAADAQGAFRGGEAAALDDGLEDAQQADFEVADLAQTGATGFRHFCLTNSKLSVRRMSFNSP
ncbi:hypothetical protein D3C78_914940 [compost metagenome]